MRLLNKPVAKALLGMKFREGKGFSLFYRFLVAFLGIVVVICGILAILFYFFSKKSIERHTKENLVRQFSALGNYIDYELKNDLIRNLQVLASNPTLDEYLMSSENYREVNARAVERLFLQTIHYLKSFDKIYFADYSGKEKIKVDRDGRVRQYRFLGDTLLFKRIESAQLGDLSVEGPFADGGKTILSIAVGKIDADIGKFGGAVIIDYGMDNFLNYLDNIRIFNIDPVWVLHPDGQEIKRPSDKEHIFDPRPYMSKEIQVSPVLKVLKDGIFLYQDFSIIQGEPLMRVAISIPASLLLQDTRSVMKFLFYVFISSIFGATLVAGYLSGYLARPINELALAAQRLAKNEPSGKVQVKAKGEVGILVESFNKMAEDLERTTVSKGYLDNIINSMIEALIVAGPDGKITSTNDATCAMLSMEEEALIGQPLDIIFGESLSDGESVLHTVIDKGFVSNLERTFVDKYGEKTPVLFSASVMHSGSGSIQGIVCVAQDITENRKLEAQLRHAQKMEAIGTLTGGIAHDFNNILTAVIGNCNLLQMKINYRDPLRHYVDDILSSSERAAALTRRLLTFSRKQMIFPKPLNLNEIINKVGKLLLSIIGEDVELKMELADEEMIIKADEGQMEQVLINMATNARDAMPNGGLLLIETSPASMSEEFITAHQYGKPGMYACLSVSDTGMGIDPELRERIFEPFFTTKDVGKGTGLGLSITYGIIKQHNGYINVYSEPSKGSTFKIYLPLVQACIVDEGLPKSEDMTRGAETILLAEDDDAVRKSLREIIEELGYKVIDAVDGDDAVNKFMREKENIHLSILDIVMPKKNGKEVYEEIMKVNPKAKVLFMSGYTRNIIEQKGIIEEGLDFIAKPVSPRVLMNKIREMLHS